MTDPHPANHTSPPTPATGGGPASAPTRRVLTSDDLRAIHAAARAAGDPLQLLRGTLTVLAAALGEPAGRTTTSSGVDLSAPLPHLTGYTIPGSQWEALFHLITGRAQAWGLAAEIGLELATNLLPTPDNDPDPDPAPPGLPTLEDLRPVEHHLVLTRGAVQVIAACQAHLQQLASAYHPASTVYRLAADSWHTHLSGLLTGFPDAHLSGHGPLGLLIETGGGTAWTLTYQPQVRSCTTPGCHAVVHSDGTIHAATPGAMVLDHTHVPSYPLDAPAPGTWIATY